MYASAKQRRFLHAPPRIEQLPAPSSALDFSGLRARGLIGISDNVLRDHLELYGRYVRELAEIDAARPFDWRSPPTLSPAEVQQVLQTRVGDLALEIEGQLREAIDQVEGELQDRGITWRPQWYLGDSDFWTTDQAVSINLPWFLANPALWDIVNENYLRYSKEDVVRILRHETGHALGYAFELWKLQRWGVAFGDFHEPYRDDFVPDPARAGDFVTYLGDNTSAPLAHYGQKHPDEDWAETFATWLDDGSRWRETYAESPVALAKLETVQTLLVDLGAAYGEPVNQRSGRRVPYQTLDFTVAEFVGEDVGPSPVAAELRRLPLVYDAVVLHEAYFGGLARGAGVGVPAASRFGDLATMAYGSFDAWAADLRAAARASSGWVLTVWDRRGGRLRNVLVDGHDVGVPAGADLLVALDVWEHAYAGDVGIRKDLYVGAWWRNVAWSVVEMRTTAASPPPPPPVMALVEVERPWPGLDLPPGATGTIAGET